jgi:hypothetical protein
VNLAQSEILDLLTRPHDNYMAIGDDDQTIYRRVIMEQLEPRLAFLSQPAAERLRWPRSEYRPTVPLLRLHPRLTSRYAALLPTATRPACTMS